MRGAFPVSLMSIRKAGLAVVTVLVATVATGCSLAAPKYNAKFENVQTLRDAELGNAKVGDFVPDPAAKQDVNRLTIRGSSYVSPYNGSFVAYLQEAIRQELYDARLLEPNAAIEISGLLMRNELDGSGINVGIAEIEARFVVRRDGQVRFDKVKSARHEWESAFAGATAIPRAQQQYPTVVEKLLTTLYSDPDFLSALKR